MIRKDNESCHVRPTEITTTFDTVSLGPMLSVLYGMPGHSGGTGSAPGPATNEEGGDWDDVLFSDNMSWAATLRTDVSLSR